RITNKKVGVVISPDQASPENFVTAIKRVLGDSTIRGNVRREQKAIRSVDGLSIAADILERTFGLEERQQGRPKIDSNAEQYSHLPLKTGGRSKHRFASAA